MAAVAALDDLSYVQTTVDRCIEEMQRLIVAFQEINLEVIPSAANFLTLVFDSEEKAISFNKAMLRRGVILRHLSGWGLSSCIRVTVGTKEGNKYLIKCMSEILYPE